MTKSRAFQVISSSFILGVALSSFYYPQIFGADFFYFPVILALIIFSVFYKNKTGIIVVLSVLFFILGTFLTSGKINRIKNNFPDGQNFSGKVLVTEEPEIKEKYQATTVEGNGLRFLVRAGLYPQYFYGDELSIDCILKIPKNFDDSEFDYRMYLAKENIPYVCEGGKITKAGAGKGNFFYSYIFLVKNKFSDKILRLVPYPESALLEGLLLGGDGRLPENLQNDFSKTGMTHIVAVSGYNVTIIAEYLMLVGIFLGLWRRQAFWFSVIGIIIFVILVGAPSSALRAGVMGILILWAMKKGRLANSGNAILCAASIMLLKNPLLLRWDIGFQLSFFATLGISYLYPIFEDFFGKIFEKNHPAPAILKIIIETLLLSLAAQIFVLPIILYNFKSISLISPLDNILILPFLPLTMLLGFLTSFFGFLFFPLAKVFSYLVFVFLRYEISIISLSAGWKYSSFDIRSFSWWGVLFWYMIIIGLVIFYNRKKFKRDEK